MAELPVRVMFPVPNAIDRVLLLLEKKIPVLNVLLFKSNVPLVNVTVRVEPTVQLS